MMYFTGAKFVPEFASFFLRVCRFITDNLSLQIFYDFTYLLIIYFMNINTRLLNILV